MLDKLLAGRSTLKKLIIAKILKDKQKATKKNDKKHERN